MTAAQILQQVLNVLVALGLPGLAIFYFRDRRKNRVETLVAEETAQNQIDLSSITSVQAHIGLIENAFKAERESKDRTIADLQDRLTQSEALAAQQRQELESVRAELERLREQVDRLNRELRAASQRIEALLDATSEASAAP